MLLQTRSFNPHLHIFPLEARHDIFFLTTCWAERLGRQNRPRRKEANKCAPGPVRVLSFSELQRSSDEGSDVTGPVSPLSIGVTHSDGDDDNNGKASCSRLCPQCEAHEIPPPKCARSPIPPPEKVT